MNSNKVLLLVLMLLAVVAIGVALLSRGADVDSPRLSMEGLDATKAQQSQVSAAPVELSRAPATDPRKSEGLAPPPMTTLAGAVKLPTEQDWAAKYAGLTGSQLEERSGTFFKELCALVNPELRKLYDAGQYEALDEGRTHRVTEEEKALNGMWMLVSVPSAPGKPDGENRRVILPESRYPELYAMHREEVWLRKRARDEKDVEWRQANAATGGSSRR